MLLGESAPPRLSGMGWSITYPGHAPLLRRVDGHGLDRLKESLVAVLRLMRPLESLGHEEHRDELALPLLVRGGLLPAEARMPEDDLEDRPVLTRVDLPPDDLEDLIPDDDLARDEEPRVPFAASGATRSTSSNAGITIL